MHQSSYRSNQKNTANSTFFKDGLNFFIDDIVYTPNQNFKKNLI